MPATKPNIILVMTDQQRYNLSAHAGFPLPVTPFLDEIAGQGVRFDHAYTAAPICGPARVSLFTGRFPSAHGVTLNYDTHRARYQTDLIDALCACGYHSAMIGKNHSHLTPEKLDHWYEFSHNGAVNCSVSPQEAELDQWLHNLNHGVSLSPTPFPLACQPPVRLVDHAIDWIDAQQDDPFFIWLSFAEPHNPYQVPEPYFSMFPPESLPPVQTGPAERAQKGFTWEWTHHIGQTVYPDYDTLLPRMRANYCGMTRLIDDQLRRLHDHLCQTGQWDNTIFVFCADHGDFMGEYGLMRKGPELPEALMHIPLQLCGPGVTARNLHQPDFVSMVDLMPTLLGLLGQPIPHGVQGRDLTPMLSGMPYPAEEFCTAYGEQGFGGLFVTAADHPEQYNFRIPGPCGDSFDCLNTVSQSGTLRMLRKGDWKLVFDMMGSGQLYDLSTDPFELCNRFADPACLPIAHDLMKHLLAWCLRLSDPLFYNEHPVILVDGEPHPHPSAYGIKRDPHNYYTSQTPAAGAGASAPGYGEG